MRITIDIDVHDIKAATLAVNTMASAQEARDTRENLRSVAMNVIQSLAMAALKQADAQVWDRDNSIPIPDNGAEPDAAESQRNDRTE